MSRLLKTCLFLCLLYWQQASAQQVFIDQSSNLPIPSVNIYNSKGNLIGFSNKDGLLELIPELKNKLSYPLEIYAQHIAYSSKSFQVSSSNAEQQLYLTARANLLEEILVSKPSSAYVCLRGYFRSLETFNLQHKYFAEGIIAYYIPLQKKGKVKYRLLDYRIYRDSTVVDDYNEKMSAFIMAPHIPQLTYGKLKDRLLKYEILEKDKQNFQILKKNAVVGSIQSNATAGSLSFYLDGVLPDSVAFKKLFRLEAKVRHEVFLENYSNTSLANASAKDLSTVYQLITGSIKRKAEHGHIPYEVINELYILDRKFLAEPAYKQIESSLQKSIYYVPKKSQYSHAFWEAIDPAIIGSLNSGVAKQLGQNLKLVE